MTSVYIVDRLTGDKTGFEAKPGDTPAYFLPEDSSFDLFLNGHSVTCQPDYELKDGDCVYAIHRPDGADPVTIAVAVAVITAIVTVALLPRPEKPNTQGVQRTSPNNQVSGQTNIARTGEGIPDIKGQIRAYPDLVQEAWYTYEENRRRVRERFCVGLSTIDITEVQDNDTDFSRITGSDFTVIERPVNSTDEYPIRANSLDDARLLAENQRVLEMEYIYLASIGSVNYVIVGSDPGQNTPQLLDLDNEADFTISGTTSSTINGTYRIDKSNNIVASQEIAFYTQGPTGPVRIIIDCHRIPVLVSSNFPAYSNGSCTNEPGATCNPAYIVNGAGQTVVGSIRVGEDTDGFTDWTLIGATGTGSFDWDMNLIFPSGFIRNNGSSETISLQVQARDSVTQQAASFSVTIDGQVIDVGSDVTFDISGRTRGPLGRTIEFAQTQPNTGNRVEIRIRRASDVDLNNSVSDVNIETLFSRVRYPAGSAGTDFTLLSVDARSDFTNRSTSSRQINCLAARRQHSYNSTTDTITARNSNNRSFADAILDDAVRLFGETRTRQLFDLESLYEVSDGLSSDLRGFNYSFDDINISFGQRIHTICNVARVGAFRDGQIWRFFREEEKPVTQTFDRRNIAGNSESSQSFNLQKPNGNDSIRLSYINPDDNKERHIDRRINTNTKAFESGIGSRPLEIDLAGCRNESQAINRAELEVRRLVYQRRRVMERVLDDGLLVDIGDRVRWACIYDDATTDAEVLEISGTQLRLSERPVLEQGMSYFGHISDQDGNVHGPYSITQGSNGDFWVDGFDVTKAYVANHAANVQTQLGSRVIIGTDEDLNYYDFTVTAKTPADDGTVQLELIEYNNLMFSED